MQNETTNPTSLNNIVTTVSGVVNEGTAGTGMVNSVTVGSGIDQTQFSTTRFDGLWVRFVQPWELESPWTYEAIQKSNVEITNQITNL